MFTYCVFCQTAKCDYVAKTAEQQYRCQAISPKQVQHTRSKGKMVDYVHDLLPGYVFLYSEEAPIEIVSVQAIQGVIRCLSDHEHRFELSGADEQFALMLLHKDGVIGKTKVYREGDRISICKGAFLGVEAQILKVNRRNMRMQIEIPFASRTVKTWVEYEVVEKDND